MVQGLLVYAVLVSAAVFIYGYVVNERAEQLVWTALLESEFDRIVERHRATPEVPWEDTATLSLFGDRPDAPLPVEVRLLAPGLHDELMFDGKQWVVLIREVGGAPWALALDIEDLERRESYLYAGVLGFMLLLVVVLGVLIGWGVDRLTRPLRTLAHDIAHLQPDRAGGRVGIELDATTELAVIADAINDYIARNERYVERERAFLDTVSHELRTPIAVIGGAAELAGSHPDIPEPVRLQLARIRRTGREIERLITLVLVLAKDPMRLARASDRVALGELLIDIVDDHRPLALQKGLVLNLQPSPRCDIHAPLPVVQAAIANLLRNAIENSDSGAIAIHLERDGAVVIADPGHGMTPEQISAIYARMARGGGREGGREGGGIGLDLIARLCEHLGWRLDMSSHPGAGTTARLEFNALDPDAPSG